MVCRHWIKATYQLENIDTGEIITVVKFEENSNLYHVALHQLEYFISKIITANFRKSWLFNNLLNNSKLTPFYWHLKAFIFQADKVIL